ncbi:hypothetical protein LOTGIDRAFT_174594 [Lottia gigantea]|uniref:Fucolectin tachylectin-4 pentraxin-1 domain-containing protein n=1 Tax=Lottia gigantea TaxID=225164 RepID=V4AQN1_LOTGI|nr:hypothetical protein LOTGIDRAFT_174594 [Lottia gigantea]ESO97135.1 hypothetical protein LOTGIDRAFT_174594 [Lottia gigantea]
MMFNANLLMAVVMLWTGSLKLASALPQSNNILEKSEPFTKNIALNKPTSMSSVNHKYVACKGVDGKLTGFAHTKNSDTEWWCVDLEKVYDFQSVVLYNRRSKNQVSDSHIPTDSLKEAKIVPIYKKKVPKKLFQITDQFQFYLPFLKPFKNIYPPTLNLSSKKLTSRVLERTILVLRH